MNECVIRSRVDAKVKARAAKLFEKMGLTLSEAIRIFLYQSLSEQALPFPVELPKVPNSETIAALKEADAHPEKGQKVTLKDIEKIWKDACA